MDVNTYFSISFRLLVLVFFSFQMYIGVCKKILLVAYRNFLQALVTSKVTKLVTKPNFHSRPNFFFICIDPVTLHLSQRFLSL